MYMLQTIPTSSSSLNFDSSDYIASSITQQKVNCSDTAAYNTSSTLFCHWTWDLGTECKQERIRKLH